MEQHIPHEVLVSPDRLSDEVMNRALVSVGNHEAKALLVSGMDPNQSYGMSDAHKVLMRAQGSVPVWAMGINVPHSYLRNSFLRHGVVERDSSSETEKYKLTNFGKEDCPSIAGGMLQYSEQHPNFSIQALLGSSSSRIEESVSPAIRRRILSVLANAEHFPLQMRDLISLTHISPGVLEAHISELSRRKVILYETTKPDASVASYTFPLERRVEEPEGFKNQPALSKKVWEAIQSGKLITVSPNTVQELLIADDPQRASLDRRAQRNLIAVVLNRFEKQGYLIKSKFSGQNRSEIILSDEARTAIHDFIVMIDKLQNDPEARLEGLQQGKAILSDPAKVNMLMEKAMKASGNAKRIDSTYSAERVIDSIRKGDITTSQIMESLALQGIDLSMMRVRSIVNSLIASGKINVDETKQQRYYSVNEEN